MGVALVAAWSGCGAGDERPSHLVDTTAMGTATARAPGSVEPSAPSAPPPAASSAASTSSRSDDAARCPADMVRVEGAFCPEVTQRCVERQRDEAGAGSKDESSERCLVFERPSLCVSAARVRMGFCMDRFEYPNREGELPRVLVSWTHAKKLCEAAGKRLCTEAEFDFACEGPDMKPYAYGFVRDASACNIDKPYRPPNHRDKMLEQEACERDAACKRELARLDQREPAGARKRCVSDAGVFDLNGNVNEWVELPNESAPNRSGLKGGWWGPIRARCRPTVRFHKEDDYGYEAGFRCCADLP